MSLTVKPIGCYVAQLLASYGLDTVFGIPGVHTLELYRGLTCEPRLRHILTRHEQGAGFAADGYARACGRPAAAYVISGPGLTNILTSVAQANSDSVPMVVVASTPVRSSLGRRWGVLHELADQHGVAKSVLDLVCTASCAEDIRDFLGMVFEEFRRGRPRPAYLGVPLDLLAETTTLIAESRPSAVHAASLPTADIARAVALLSGAQRPLIIAGGGARAATAELRRLVEAVDGFLVTTAAGKGVLPEAHRCNLGGSLPYGPTRRLLEHADVVLAVGTEISETDTYAATKLTFPGHLIRIDINSRLNDLYPAAIDIRSDAQSVLAALALGVEQDARDEQARRVPQRPGWCTRIGDAAAIRAQIDVHLDSQSIRRRRGLEAIRAALPAGAAVFSDMTQIAYLGNYAFAMDRPGNWHHPSGYGTLGFALPAALGAKLADPQRAVIALAGDFGLQFTLGELATAVEHRLNVPVVLWNNSALGQIRDDMLAADIPSIGVVARNPDFLGLARAYGAQAVRSSSASQLTAALTDALALRGPTVIEVDETDFSWD